ncbi:MAG: type I polyketide synthase [Pyrinomonadaceae bacterium]
MSQATSTEELTGLEVAVVGLALRFPGARSAEEFWRNLRDGVESVAFFSDEELLAAGTRPELLARPDFVRAYGALEGVELFDAPFFGFTPREATIMDPQHRLFLECAWEALEHAGLDPETYGGAVGVFGGAGLNTYLGNLFADPEFAATIDHFQAGVANDKDFLTTRVSYKLNLKGPSVVIQSACSTSLVAVHMACQSLLSGACDTAMAGGVTVIAQQRRGYLYQEGGIMSPDGHCRAFDARAGGTVGGSGVGVVVLKRLEDAMADGDSIHAVIKGSAINNDGAVKVGYTAPSVDGQAEVIRTAQAVAGVEPETVTYVEAHGTGTELGDPIEVAALTGAFGAATRKKNFCAIGSVKSNFGHLDAAAGVAGFIKAALALEHRTIPPSLHFTEPNPRIDFAASPFYVSVSAEPWPAGATPRRAGVSSFGIGGTNAHVVLEEAPRLPDSGASRPAQLLILSARTRTALEAMTDNLSRHIEEHPGINLADAAYTLKVGRRGFRHRRALVCRDAAEAAEALASRRPGRLFEGETAGEPSIVFMFPGQGAQHVGMGRELYETEKTFRDAFDLCAELLAPRLGADLREVVYPAGGATEEAGARLRQTAFTQPALFAVEYALAHVWLGWGVRPRALVGHSVGEYVAACLAGVFTLEDALRLVAERAALMQSLRPGAMTAVALSEDEVGRMLGASLSVASVNTPASCVVSGPVEAVEEFERRLAERGAEGRRLSVSHAFHSAMTEPILETFAAAFEDVALRPPETPYLSNVTGRWVTREEATDPRYWAAHLRRTVRFADGLGLLLSEPSRVLVEVGPGRALCGFVKQHPSANAVAAIPSMRHARERKSDAGVLLEAAGRLWLAGASSDWAAFYAGERRRRLHLPTYPFERQRYWVDRPRAANGNGLASEAETIEKRDAVAAPRTSPPEAATTHAAGGNGAGPEWAPEHELEELFAQQLGVISRQLGLLRGEEEAP